MVDCETVRQMALALPGVEEHDHWGRPSFRVKNKIFATLWPNEQRAVLKLPLADQSTLTSLRPETYAVVPGAWGDRGSTFVELETVDRAEFQEVLKAAWYQVAPKRLIVAYEQSTQAGAAQ